MDDIPMSWSEIAREMLPRNECDICIPPLDIGPPPPLPANFQDKEIISGGCNMCNMLSDVEMRPIHVSDASLLPVAASFVVGVLIVLIMIVILLLKVKKCQGFFSNVCWIFPRNVLPHTELSPSSVPSPSPSMEKLKSSDNPKLCDWRASSRSLQSENIYEVCAPPSEDRLYEEVEPKMDPDCSPYGIMPIDGARNYQPYLMQNVVLQGNRFQTMVHGYHNPAVNEAQYGGSLQISSFRPRGSFGNGGYVQKRELPPVPRNRNY